MQVKTFEAKDMASGLRAVRKELGSDALILSTRTIRSGALGLLGKSVIEITAAIDQTFERKPDSNLTQGLSSHKSPSTRQSTPPAGYTSRVEVSVNDDIEPIDYSKEFRQSTAAKQNQQQTAAPDFPVNQSGATRNQTDENESLKMEMHELKKMVRSLTTAVAQISSTNHQEDQVETKPSPLLEGVRNNLLPETSFDDPVIDLLLSHGVNLETSKTISDFTKDSVADINSDFELNRYIKNTISSLIQTEAPSLSSHNGQQRIALIGPTGVGKTTTLAKMAAKYLSEHSRSIALITIDTYRIAAVEQLKVYGEIMQLPVEVVITPAELKTAIARHSDKELILIDTAGRSPQDNYCIDELQTFFVPELDIQKHLVLSATTRETELVTALTKFDSLGIDQTIITKIDECSTLGVLLNIQIQNPNPISFITNGQRVPEDILVANQNMIAELILPNNEGLINEQFNSTNSGSSEYTAQP